MIQKSLLNYEDQKENGNQSRKKYNSHKFQHQNTLFKVNMKLTLKFIVQSVLMIN